MKISKDNIPGYIPDISPQRDKVFYLPSFSFPNQTCEWADWFYNQTLEYLGNKTRLLTVGGTTYAHHLRTRFNESNLKAIIDNLEINPVVNDFKILLSEDFIGKEALEVKKLYNSKLFVKKEDLSAFIESDKTLDYPSLKTWLENKEYILFLEKEKSVKKVFKDFNPTIEGVNYLIGDVQRFNPKEKYDLILFNNVLDYAPIGNLKVTFRLKRVNKIIKKLVKKDGLFEVTAWLNKRNNWLNKIKNESFVKKEIARKTTGISTRDKDSRSAIYTVS